MQTMNAETRFDWSSPIKTGLMGGVAALLLALMGIVEASHGRPVISGVVSLGQTLLLLTFVLACTVAVRRARSNQETPPRWRLFVSGALAGLMVSIFLVVLVLVGSVINMRTVFIQASPGLYSLLTLGLGTGVGTVVLLILGPLLGVLIAALSLLPGRIERALVLGLGAIPVLAVLYSAFFSGRRLSPLGALVLFIVFGGGSYLWSGVQAQVKQRIESLPLARQRAYKIGQWALAALVVLLLPLTGSYPSQVLDMVGLYVLMGLGLNIVVGFAGLLDLGYVAFFALGAYTMGILTSPEIGWLGFHLNFWEALFGSLVVGALTGVILGVPVLGMRGDYLAIVTMGFGEIIRIVALSDWLKPYIGGSNGITRIPKPAVGSFQLDTPGRLYFIIVIGCLIAAFVATRVKDSRIGRAWMALREDEDVAQAMGIDLVRTKLLAFSTGAAFSAVSGGIFATMITSIYPHSFHLLVSINVLGLIIVGGMGSIPGVIVGSLALVGLPEILREFSEYRLLMYGAALVYMMLVRPEGLLPEARRKLELHEAGAGE
jgi:branched-chain amino acid transport system permease protein